MKFKVQPSNVVHGVKIAPAVVVDLENVVSTDAVTVSLGFNPSNGVLSGHLTHTAVAGKATFNDLALDKAGVGYKLLAVIPGKANVTSTAFNVT